MAKRVSSKRKGGKTNAPTGSKRKPVAQKKKAVPVRDIEYGGEKYFVPVTGRGIVLEEEEKIKVAELVCLIHSNGESIEYACNYVGMDRGTFYNWRNAIPQVQQLYQEAFSAFVDSRREAVGESILQSLPDKINDKIVWLEETVGEPYLDPTTNKMAIKTVLVRRKQAYIKASPTFAMFLLKSIYPDRFASLVAAGTGVNGLAGGEHVPASFNVVIRKMDDYPVYNKESDIPEDFPDDYVHKQIAPKPKSK